MEFQKSKDPISSDVQLFSLRTLEFDHDDDFINSTTKSIEMLSFKYQ